MRYARAVELQTADEVWARVEALARAQAGGVVATDGDGTLWSGDVGEDLFHAFLEHGRVEAPAHEAIGLEAREKETDISAPRSGPNARKSGSRPSRKAASRKQRKARSRGLSSRYALTTISFEVRTVSSGNRHETRRR